MAHLELLYHRVKMVGHHSSKASIIYASQQQSSSGSPHGAHIPFLASSIMALSRAFAAARIFAITSMTL